MLKSIEPILGLRFVFDDKDIGTFYTNSVKYYMNKDITTELNKDQPKMTREEALDKIGGDHEKNQLLLIKLEALGLIKFDEVKEDDNKLINALNCTRGLSPKNIILHLHQCGYKIVKKD